MIYGDGSQTRSYCYVTDTAWATVEALLRQSANNEVINIGNSSRPISLLDLAILVVKTCNKSDSLTPKFENNFKHTDRTIEREIFHRYCSTEKAYKLLKYTPKVSIEEGIEKVVDSGMLFTKWESTDLIYTMQDMF